MRHATACSVVFSGMTLCGMVLRTRMPAPPCGLLLLVVGGRLVSRL